jgi:hypothetical protein
MRTMVLLFLISVAFAPQCFGLSTPITYPIELTKQEVPSLEKLACRVPLGAKADRITAWRYDPKSPDANAEVICLPHTDIEGRPVHGVVSCARSGGRWKCEAPQLRQLVSLSTGKLIVQLSEKGVIDAHDVIVKLAAKGWFKGAVEVDHIPVCLVQPGPYEELRTVSCEGWRIIVSTWCPQNDCPRVISWARDW